jgi:hypothetical protein
MLYVVVPHRAMTYDVMRFFMSYSAVEQAVLVAAKGFEADGFDPDWCCVIAYEGIDELVPVFLYTLYGSARLVREKWPSPSP